MNHLPNTMVKVIDASINFLKAEAIANSMGLRVANIEDLEKELVWV